MLYHISDLPVFTTHFNPNNSLLILLQISLLFLCTRLNCKPFEESEMYLTLKWVRVAISGTGISYLMNSSPASIISFTQSKSSLSTPYNVSYKPDSWYTNGQLTRSHSFLGWTNAESPLMYDAVIFLGDITQISGNECKLAWPAHEKNRRTTEGPLEDSSLPQPVT